MFEFGEMEQPKRQDRRRAGRITCALTKCQFGEVRDMSKGGCRVIGRKPLELPAGASVNLIVKAQGASLTVPACPVSNRQRADGKWEIGFQFLNLTAMQCRDVLAFARAALDNEQLRSRAA
ncbi:MAG TPA: PilZ domain-containing protein [Phycisphaerales bacterium]|nr:PilZ domain-containing protein [Phycisphaerales bacterium]